MSGSSGGGGGLPGRGGGSGGGRGIPGRDGGGGGMAVRGGGGKPFAGVNFKLVGFDHRQEEQLQLTLENAGAAHALVQTSDIQCTHLIVCSNSIAYHNEWCEKGRNKGLNVLNELWIRDSLQLGRPASVMNVRYRPKIDLNGVKGAEKMIICCQGYPDQFMKIQDIATLIGAQLYPELRPETTHLMSYKQEGLDYQNAIKQGVAIINITWLADCLSEWKICPPKGKVSTIDYVIDSQRRFHSHGNKFLTPTPKAPSARSRRECKTEEAKKDLSRRSKDFASTSKKLDFGEPPEKKLPVYASSRRKLVECILLPASITAVEATKPFFKCVLNNAYIQLVEHQSRDKSPAGQLSADNFYLLDLTGSPAGKLSAENFDLLEVSGSVQLTDFEPAPASDANCKADRKSFVIMVERLFDNDVPPDVAVWLKGILEGWNNNVLCNLANMAHPNNGYAYFQPLYHLTLKLKMHQPEEHGDLLEILNVYNTWKSSSFNWLTLEENKTYYNFKSNQTNNYDPDLQGLLGNIRDTFEHPAKAYARDFLDIMMGDFPSLMADLQRVLYDLGLLPELDFIAPSAERKNRRCISSGGKKDDVMSANFKLKSPVDVSLQEYASERDKLVDPAATNGIELTEPFFKAFLSSCYVQVVRQHQGKRSLVGNVQAQHFWYSEASSLVEIRGVEKVPSSSQSCKDNKDSFVQMVKDLFENKVPVDVEVWLKCISSGWDENILCHFITMAHPDNAYGQFQTLHHIMVKLEKFEPIPHANLLKVLNGYDNWQRDTSYRCKGLETGKKTHRRNIMGLLENIRDYFESQRKVDPCADDFLDTILAVHPRVLAILQKLLYDMGLLPQLDWRTAR